MVQADELLVEERSRLSILVIEGDGRSGFNALVGLSGYHYVEMVADLEQAMKALSYGRFDMVLSGTEVPLKQGGEPEEAVTQVMAECLWAGTPVCFITEEGARVDFQAEGYISITATPGGEMLATEVEIEKPRDDPQSSNLFRILRVSKDNGKGESKTPDIWKLAFEMTKAASRGRRPAVASATRRIAGANADVKLPAKVVTGRR